MPVTTIALVRGPSKQRSRFGNLYLEFTLGLHISINPDICLINNRNFTALHTDASLTAESDPPPRDFIAWLSRSLQQHPGMVATFGYLVLTAVGIGYDVLLYRLFGIPILIFSEPNDFLLAGFRQPIILLLFLFSIVALFRVIRVDKKLRLKSDSYKRLADMMERKTVYSNWVMYLSTIVVYFFSLSSFDAKYTSDNIRRGNGPTVEIQLNSNSGNFGANQEVGCLIGSNSKYVFLYNFKESPGRILPVANIVRTTVHSATAASDVKPIVAQPSVTTK